MSILADDNSLTGRIRIDEKDSTTIENPPKDIEEQLKAVEFERKSANVYVKKRKPYTGSTSKKVVEVEVYDDSLTLSSESVVGVVNLTPTSKVQIDPRIGWSEILDMFLKVQEENRSIEYQGVPIREFLGDDLAIEDIFVIIAVNYLNSLEPVWREGLVRTFKTQEYDAITGRGRLDIQKSLLNRSNPKNSHLQRFVEKKVEYDIPVHRLLHRAGIELLKLFKLHSGKYNHEGYYRIFESMERAIHRFEEHGIDSSSTENHVYREVSLYDLPPTRHYYQDCIRTSKMILSSSTGQPMATAEQDLTMDYILNMNDLFEKYTQVVLEDEIRRIKSSTRYTGPKSLDVSSSSLINLFEDESNLTYRPDHVIRNSEEPIAVLDSKYYDRDKDPLKDNYARSRLFSYGYFLNVTDLAFLVPAGGTMSHPLTGKDGNLTVVAPEEFNLESYIDSIRDYLQNLLDEYLEPNQLLIDLQENIIPIDGKSCNSLSDIEDKDTFAPRKVKMKSSHIVRNIAKRYSSEVSHYRNVEWRTISRAVSNLFNHHNGNDYAIPIFRRSTPEKSERLIIHFIEIDHSEGDKIHTTCGPYKIDWKKDGDTPLIKIE